MGKNANQTVTLPIGGMSCASCAARIEKGLRNLSGIKEANVNLATEKAVVTYDPQVLNEEGLIRTIEDLGYKVPLPENKAEKMVISVGGMTCAACVRKVEKALAALDGVSEASVNLATEKATVLYQPGLLGKADFRKVIEDLGYEVRGFDEILADQERQARAEEIRRQKRKFVFSACLTAAAFIGSFPEWFPWWPKVLREPITLFILTTPVQFWAGWQFYRGFWSALKHRTSDMNTLIAVGTSAAYVYSTVVTFFPGVFRAYGLKLGVYYDTAAMIITLILLGKLLEAIAKGHTSEAIKRLMGLQGQDCPYHP